MSIFNLNTHSVIYLHTPHTSTPSRHTSSCARLRTIAPLYRNLRGICRIAVHTNSYSYTDGLKGTSNTTLRTIRVEGKYLYANGRLY